MGKWIPCRERMPEPHENVLVTVDVEGDMFIEIAEYYHLVDEWGFKDEYYSYTMKNFEVMAWMSLPEPYGEEEQ